jgi:hypothetical protein
MSLFGQILSPPHLVVKAFLASLGKLWKNKLNAAGAAGTRTKDHG